MNKENYLHSFPFCIRNNFAVPSEFDSKWKIKEKIIALLALFLNQTENLIHISAKNIPIRCKILNLLVIQSQDFVFQRRKA